MGLESGTFVNDLVDTNPLGSDQRSDGDNHLRLIKAVLKSTFPGMAGRVNRVQDKSAGYTVVLNDNTSLINCTANLTLALTAAATLGNGFTFYAYAPTGVTVTIDPNSTELINGVSTLTVSPGEFALVFCNGTAFLAIKGRWDGTIADGDKGDITVTGGAWTIDNNAITTAKLLNDAVTYDKMQNVSATSRILGRKTAAAGDTEECTLSEVLDFIGSAAQGDILYRGASAWARLAAGTNGQFLKTLGAGANPAWDTLVAGMTSGTAVATTSGSVVDFGSLPAGIKQLTVAVRGVSFSLSNSLSFRLGTGGTPQNSGYVGMFATVSTTANTTTGNNSITDGFDVAATGGTAPAYDGTVIFTRLDSSTHEWTVFGILRVSNTPGLITFMTGSVDLSGELDILRIYGGTFDAGKVNITYSF
jgi:hypothetical protein